MNKYAVILGSNGHNLSLGQHFAREIEELGHEAILIDLPVLDLPLYSFAAESKGIPPEVMVHVDLLTSCRGLVWVAPEYNGGIPPQITNYLAWISRSGSSDWRACFKYKKAAIASHSGGGGHHVLSSLRQQLAYIGMNVIGHQVIVNSTKQLNLDSVKVITNQLTI